ncbi:hypothetical protein BpHYR1_024100 [Brachionus plicatilis]|uniref:Uncharacterized protein n=1 Tax=Brachionus plicatilis TaxID=10195 RepID=A0A3M7PU37_BRAPC|nr:hypothetical protein BpHYR1_024100 [Brachionus plicatilis]
MNEFAKKVEYDIRVQRVHMMLFVSWMLFALDIQSSISPHKKTAFASLSQASTVFSVSDSDWMALCAGKISHGDPRSNLRYSWVSSKGSVTTLLTSSSYLTSTKPVKGKSFLNGWPAKP